MFLIPLSAWIVGAAVTLSVLLFGVHFKARTARVRQMIPAPKQVSGLAAARFDPYDPQQDEVRRGVLPLALLYGMLLGAGLLVASVQQEREANGVTMANTIGFWGLGAVCAVLCMLSVGLIIREFLRAK